MASQSQMDTGDVKASQTDQEWTSPLLADERAAPSYADPNWLPVRCKEKRTTLSRETKALAKSSVGQSGVHPWHIPIEIITGTHGLGLSAPILDGPHCLGRQPSPNRK